MAGQPERPRERRDRFSTISDVEIRRVYGPADPDGGEAGGTIGDLARGIGVPGAPPFTRGIHPTGYRGRLWTMPPRRR